MGSIFTHDIRAAGVRFDTRALTAGPDTAVYVAGRPNQVNSTPACPGMWRDLLDVRASLMAAACAIAQVVAEEGAVAADYVVPSVFNRKLVPAVAAAVADASQRAGVARIAPAE